MGIDPNEICLSIPGEQMPTVCEVLKLWRDRGKKMFTEAPPNEERLFVQVPYDASYGALARIDHEKGVKPSEPQDLETTYIPWSQRRKRKAKSYNLSGVKSVFPSSLYKSPVIQPDLHCLNLLSIITPTMKVREYIFLAAGCVAVGVGLTFVVLGVAQRLEIDIDEQIWVLAVPAVLAIALNIALLELYHRYRRKK